MTRFVLACLTMLHLAAARAAEPAASPEPPAAESEETDGPAQGSLPIPRFVSLRADSVNLRVGPNARYPIEWIYVRRNLPVEVIAEFDTWRRIKDPAGTEGWVHSSMLSGRRTAMIIGNSLRPLRRGMQEDADLVANLEPGVIVQIQRCPQETTLCRIEAGGLQGWLDRAVLWGLYPGETIN